MTTSMLLLASVLLEMAADEFHNHGCNDFNLAEVFPHASDRHEIMQAFHKANRSPDEYAPNSDYAHDYALMSWLAREFRAASLGVEQ